MDDKLSKSKRPTISFLAIILLFVGFVLGVFGTAWKFKDTYPDVHQPEKLTACAGNLVIIATALGAYKSKNDCYPTSQYSLVPEYLPELPSCPSSQRVTYRTSFGPEMAPKDLEVEDFFIIECCGENHRGGRIAPNSPSYDSIQGLVVKTGW